MKVKYLNFREQWIEDRKKLLPIISKVLSSGKYVAINSDEVLKFEKKLSSICNTKFALTMNSCTDALTLAMHSSGVKKNDEVITVSNSYIATTGAIMHLKAKPIFIDVLNNQNIDPSKIEDKITKKTKAILPVHLTGRMCDMDKINNIAKKNNLIVVEDAAQSFGAKFKKIICGSYGNITCFSGHPLKNLNAMGDAGFMTLNNKKIYSNIFSLKNHGLRSRDYINYFGYNSRLDNVQGAILNFRLTKLKRIINIRRKNAKFYQSNLNSNYVFMPNETEHEYNTYHTFVIQVPKREKLKNFLKEKGIDTYIHYPLPIHLQKPLKELKYQLPNTEIQSKMIISLPINHSLTMNQLSFVSDKINYFYKNLA